MRCERRCACRSAISPSAAECRRRCSRRWSAGRPARRSRSLNATKKQGGVGIFDNDKAPLPTVSLPKSVSVKEGNGGHGEHPLRRQPLERGDRAHRGQAGRQRTAPRTRPTTRARTARSSSRRARRRRRSRSTSRATSATSPTRPSRSTSSSPVGGGARRSKGSFGVIEDDDGPKVKIGKPRVRGKRLVTKVELPREREPVQGRAGRQGRQAEARARGVRPRRPATSQKLKLKMSKKARKALAERALQGEAARRPPPTPPATRASRSAGRRLKRRS